MGEEFTLILHANEKRGGCFNPDPSQDQLEVIMQDHELVDTVPKNRRYTWSNKRIGRGNIMERLDRILVAVTLLSYYSIASASVLPFSASDHYPITLSLGDHHSLGPLPFKYNPLWNDI